MQLDSQKGSVRRRLIAASCALLSATAARSEEAKETTFSLVGRVLSDWQLHSALAYYRENGRIQAVEPVVTASRDFEDGGKLALNMTFDTLSGSTPNGALPSRQPQTFASPSAKSFGTARHPYTAAPGRLPMDPNYSDTRVAAGADWTLALTRLTRATLGGKFSYEDDFYSVSANAALERDFNDKNTTLSIGLNDEKDFLQPIGGAPLPLSNYALFEKTGNKSKNGVGLLLSATQVMTRNWLSQFNLSMDRFSGYLNDPYRIVSVLDDAGTPTGYLYERRPDSRTRKSAYLENRIGLSRSSTALTLRYMTDNWGIHSETAQVRLRWWNSARDQYVEPTVRWYKQTAADFYQPWIANAGTPESYVSADSRLAAFHALTYGVKYGMKLSERLGPLGREGTEFTVRLEYYQQTLARGPAEPASLQGLDLYPDLKAFLIQFGFNY